MTKLLTSALLVLALAGCASGWDGMTEKQRKTYNTGPFQPECVFSESGYPFQARCNDFRMINHKANNRRKDAILTTGQGFYVKPFHPEYEEIDIPEDVKVTWYDAVSKTEVACYQLMKRTNPRPEFYPVACYDPIFKEIHVTYGDYPALKHEIRHHQEGHWHD